MANAFFGWSGSPTKHELLVLLKAIGCFPELAKSPGSWEAKSKVKRISFPRDRTTAVPRCGRPGPSKPPKRGWLRIKKLRKENQEMEKQTLGCKDF